MIKHFTLSSLVIGCTLMTAQAENLMEVYQVALDSDPVLKQAVFKQKSVSEGQNQSYSSFLPTINAGASTTGTRSTNLSSGDTSYNRNGYNISLTQSLYKRSNYINHRIAKLNISSSDADLQLARQDLISRVTNAYLDVLLAADTVEFTNAEKKAIGRQLEQAQRRYEVGIIAITAVLNAQAGFDNAQAAVIKAENDYQLARERLRDIAGQYFDNISNLKPDIPLTPPQPGDIEQWVKIALENSQAIQSLKYQLESTRENIKLQRSGHYPNFNLTASHSYSDSNGPFSGGSRSGEDSSIGIEMSLPIYQGGLISSRSRQAEYDYSNILNKYEELKRTTERQARNSYLSVISEISRVKALKQAVISNESALKATEAGFEVGTRTIVDVLNVQRDRFEAKRNHSESRYNYIRNLIFLKQSSGLLSEQDIELINDWFL